VLVFNFSYVYPKPVLTKSWHKMVPKHVSAPIRGLISVAVAAVALPSAAPDCGHAVSPRCEEEEEDGTRMWIVLWMFCAHVPTPKATAIAAILLSMACNALLAR
jgi:hypothetical protein